MVDVTDIEKLYLIKLGFGDKDSTLNTEIVFKDPAKRDTEFEKLVPKLTKPLIEGDIATSLPLIFLIKSETYVRKQLGGN